MKYPNNPYILSKHGRLCLEVGRKQEAMEKFNTVFKMMRMTSPKKPGEGVEIGADDYDKELTVLMLLNKAFINIFDGNYKDSIENFRKILAYKPMNLVAINNAATCQIFCNETQKAIETLEKVLKHETRKNLNDYVAQNLLSIYPK